MQQFEIASRELIRVGASRRFYHPACHHDNHRAFRRAARRNDDRQGSDQFPVLSQWASLGRSWDDRIRWILGRMIGDQYLLDGPGPEPGRHVVAFWPARSDRTGDAARRAAVDHDSIAGAVFPCSGELMDLCLVRGVIRCGVEMGGGSDGLVHWLVGPRSSLPPGESRVAF